MAKELSALTSEETKLFREKGAVFAMLTILLSELLEKGSVDRKDALYLRSLGVNRKLLEREYCALDLRVKEFVETASGQGKSFEAIRQHGQGTE
jgi:hypothetical protein